MAKIGYTKCPHCNNSEATVSESTGHTITLRCHRCDLTAFAKAGSKLARDIRAKMTPLEEDEPAPISTPKNTPPKGVTETAKENLPTKHVNSVFNLGAL